MTSIHHCARRGVYLDGKLFLPKSIMVHMKKKKSVEQIIREKINGHHLRTWVQTVREED
jgi:hypothetical protein